MLGGVGRHEGRFAITLFHHAATLRKRHVPAAIRTLGRSFCGTSVWNRARCFSGGDLRARRRAGSLRLEMIARGLDAAPNIISVLHGTNGRLESTCLGGAFSLRREAE